MHFLVCLWQFRGIAAVTCWWVFILQFLDTLLCVWWLLFRGISEATTPWSISRVSSGYGKCTQWALGYLHRYGLSSCSLRSFCCHQVWVFLLLLSFLDYVCDYPISLSLPFATKHATEKSGRRLLYDSWLKSWADCYILIYTHTIGSWWIQWGEVTAASQCYSWWRWWWWSNTLWVCTHKVMTALICVMFDLVYSRTESILTSNCYCGVFSAISYIYVFTLDSWVAPFFEQALQEDKTSGRLER
jgi:hypothetical protein